MTEKDKIKSLEARNLKLEFEISRLNRENASLVAEIGFLRGRGIKMLAHEMIHKVDSKITSNLKKLNKPNTPTQQVDELGEISKAHTRKELLHIVEMVDLKTYYVIPKASLYYRLPMAAYKAAYNSFLFGGRTLWRGWRITKKAMKKVVK